MKVALHDVAARHPAAKADAAAALDGLTLAVAPGEQVAVIGPSGAGKTTLLHVVAAALPPSRGAVTRGRVARGHALKRDLHSAGAYSRPALRACALKISLNGARKRTL